MSNNGIDRSAGKLAGGRSFCSMKSLTGRLVKPERVQEKALPSLEVPEAGKVPSAELLGHASIQTTAIYAHATDASKRRAVRALSGYSEKNCLKFVRNDKRQAV